MSKSSNFMQNSGNNLQTQWFYKNGRNSFDYYEFLLLLMHGSPDGLFLPDEHGGAADMDLVCLGGGPFDGSWGENSYLKWVWASSCEWFDIEYFLPAIEWYCNFNCPYRASDGSYTSGSVGGVDFNDEGVMIDCDNGDWIKIRISENHEIAMMCPHPTLRGKYDDYNKIGLNIKCLSYGTVHIYLGAPADNEADVRNTTDRIELGSLNIGGNMLGTEKMRYISCMIPPETQSHYIYLEFRGNNDICEIKDVHLYPDDNVQSWTVPEHEAVLEKRVQTWGNVFHGIHAILGWGSITTTNRSSSMFENFFNNWVKNGYSITESYFESLGCNPSKGCIPAIACARPYNEAWYHYFIETWSSATDELAAPTEQCIIMWDIPDFGWYWEPEPS